MEKRNIKLYFRLSNYKSSLNQSVKSKKRRVGTAIIIITSYLRYTTRGCYVTDLLKVTVYQNFQNAVILSSSKFMIRN